MVEKLNTLTSEELNAYLQKCTYVLLYKTDKVELLKALDVDPQVNPIDWDNCLEVRLFSQAEELHAFPMEGMGVITKDSGAEKYVDQSYKLVDKYAAVTGCKELTVRQYLAYDDDGQAYVSKTRLADVR